MSKTITVICPKCHAENTVMTPPRDGGRVVCRKCQYKFTVVSKIRTSKNVTPQPAPSKNDNSASGQQVLSAEEVMDMLSSALNQPPQKKRAQTQIYTSAPTPNNTAVIDKRPNLNTLLNQVANKVEIRQPAITEPESEHLSTPQPQLASSELLRNPALAQASAKETLATTNTPVHVPEENTTNISMNSNVNNLNNLVFTLLPNDNPNQADVPLLLNDAIEKTDAIHAKTEFLHHQQDKLSKEFNWTLATIVALTVLMMQLFYLMAVK
jgi:DNA-directed RNA polymerase subunit M/transcription elongation factor TFIIS